MRSGALIAAAGAAALLVLVSARGAPGDTPLAASAEPAVPTAARLGYPAGRWRLADMETLGRVVLHTSHIAIGYRPDAMDPDQASAAGYAARTYNDARALALELSAQARKDPSTFSALARTHTDDESSREAGGDLGAKRATGLPAEFLDALAVVAPGDVSRVIETSEAFHVLRRHTVAGVAAGTDEGLLMELPRPDRVDFEALVREGQGPVLAGLTRELVEESAAIPNVGQAVREQAEQILLQMAERFRQAEPKQRVAAYRAAEQGMRDAIGSQVTDRYLAFARDFAEQRILTR